ncbi:SusC/RagA family TonB-linked outer membrane protein [Tenacibaculum sp. 190524A02b]|uniref:SusC/RagA family TonB-linked outer membrane protein n=1 Tax=Tenacibaculum vairaonense TaxID=3137860 RepID=UPI0031FB8CAC
MRIKLLWLFFLVAQVTFAQEKIISGVVSDESGPLPGVSVIIKGTVKGAETDFDGNYSVKAKTGDVLVYSFVGKETVEQVVGSASVINVTLTDSSDVLQEVVVTALGISRDKKSLGYAVTKVDGDALNTVKTTNVTSSLSGRVAGVNITSSGNLGGSTNIIIRGGASITGSNQALYVVDGVPISNGNANSGETARGASGYDFGNFASDINPDDIENVSILKGASATALYGERGANGVILITTKKGTSKNRLGVTVSSSVTFDQINRSTLPNYQDQYGGGNKTTFDEVTIDGNTYKVVQYDVDESWGPKFDPNEQVLHWDAFDAADSSTYLKTRPWTVAKNGPEAFFRTGVLKVNNVALEGAGEKGNFRLSYTNTDQEGTIPNSTLERNVVAFNGGLNLSDKLSASVGVQYINTYAKNRPGLGYDWQNSLSFMAHAGMWMQTNVDYDRLKNYTNMDGTMRTWNRSSATNGNPRYWENPYWTVYKNYPEDTRNRLIANAVVNYEFNDWLSAMGRATIDHYDFNIETRIANGSFAQSRYTKSLRLGTEKNFDLMLNADKDITDDFNIKGMIGIGKRQNSTKGLSGGTRNGLVIDDIYFLNNTGSLERTLGDWESLIETQSVYSTLSLGYKKMLYLEFSGRNDWTSSLPSSTRSFFYPSVSTSFIFSELLSSNVISFGKLRANWAQVGRGTGFARYTNTMANIGNFGNVVRYGTRGTSANPNLVAENLESYEIGLEMQLFQNRIGFDVSYYNKKSKNLVVDGTVSSATGFFRQTDNIGELENEGFEVAINATPVKTENFTWNTGINWATNTSLVNALAPGIDSHTLNSNHVDVVSRVGQPYPILVGTDFVRDANGNKVVDADGYYKQTEDNAVIGNVNPKWRAGFSNTFTYKNFSLSTLIDTKIGGDVFSLTHRWGRHTGILAETVGVNDLGNDIRLPIADGGGIIVDGVKEDGTPNDIRVETKDAFNDSHNPEAASVFDASYVKLREVALSYNFPTQLTDKLNISTLSISLIGRNLAILHRNVDHIDPESTYSVGNVQGLDIGTLPTTRSYGVNVKLGF